jgi:hypothetical protein
VGEPKKKKKGTSTTTKKRTISAETDNESEDDDSEDEDGKPPARKTPQTDPHRTNPHEKRRRNEMDHFQPATFWQADVKPKKKKSYGSLDAYLQRVMQGAIRNILDEPEGDCKNYMKEKFPSQTPLTFLADNKVN